MRLIKKFISNRTKKMDGKLSSNSQSHSSSSRISCIPIHWEHKMKKAANYGNQKGISKKTTKKRKISTRNHLINWVVSLCTSGLDVWSIFCGLLCVCVCTIFRVCFLILLLFLFSRFLLLLFFLQRVKCFVSLFLFLDPRSMNVLKQWAAVDIFSWISNFEYTHTHTNTQCSYHSNHNSMSKIISSWAELILLLALYKFN